MKLNLTTILMAFALVSTQAAEQDKKILSGDSSGVISVDFTNPVRRPHPCGTTLLEIHEPWIHLLDIHPTPALLLAEDLFLKIRKRFPESKFFFNILNYVHVPGVDYEALRINLRESGFENADFNYSLRIESDFPARLFSQRFLETINTEPLVRQRFQRDIDSFLAEMAKSLVPTEYLIKEHPDKQIFCFSFTSLKHNGLIAIDQGSGVAIVFGRTLP